MIYWNTSSILPTFSVYRKKNCIRFYGYRTLFQLSSDPKKRFTSAIMQMVWLKIDNNDTWHLWMRFGEFMIWLTFSFNNKWYSSTHANTLEDESHIFTKKANVFRLVFPDRCSIWLLIFLFIANHHSSNIFANSCTNMYFNLVLFLSASIKGTNVESLLLDLNIQIFFFSSSFLYMQWKKSECNWRSLLCYFQPFALNSIQTVFDHQYKFCLWFRSRVC